MLGHDPSFMRERNKEGFLPIHVAAAANNVEVVELLAYKGCVNEITNLNQLPILHRKDE